jgi:hypothetical protein
MQFLNASTRYRSPPERERGALEDATLALRAGSSA